MSCRLCEWPDVNIPAERLLIKLEIGLGYADASMPCRLRSVVPNRGIGFDLFIYLFVCLPLKFRNLKQDICGLVRLQLEVAAIGTYLRVSVSMYMQDPCQGSWFRYLSLAVSHIPTYVRLGSATAPR